MSWYRPSCWGTNYREVGPPLIIETDEEDCINCPEESAEPEESTEPTPVEPTPVEPTPVLVKGGDPVVWYVASVKDKNKDIFFRHGIFVLDTRPGDSSATAIDERSLLQDPMLESKQLIIMLEESINN